MKKIFFAVLVFALILFSTACLDEDYFGNVPNQVPHETQGDVLDVPGASVTNPTQTHVHVFAAATCSQPVTCTICGETKGEKMDHVFQEANCTTPETCILCGATNGNERGHEYSGGYCTNCGFKEPNQTSDTMVWIPTNGGTKYHSRSNCSNMKDPKHVTKAEAEALGYTPCKKCH